MAAATRAPRRRDDRCIENQQPALRALPLGVKQKGILATCNYVARRHGIKKLMPIAEAKKLCPSLVLADGENLSPFRDVSKRLYALLRSYSWNGRVERLGLDEVFLDVTDVVSYNVELLNRNALAESFFCLSRSNPEPGFPYDATSFAGCVWGADDEPDPGAHTLRMRLLVASHLAHHLRMKVEAEGYTTACGISTNKLLAKLVGDKNKPQNQTTLLALTQPALLAFLDPHPLRKIPGIGTKTAALLESSLLNTSLPDLPDPLTSGALRAAPTTSPASLTALLSTPGADKSLPSRIWALLHGADPSPVKPARELPAQISIEDSYGRAGLAGREWVYRALEGIVVSLLGRVGVDLWDGESGRWRGWPRTVRVAVVAGRWKRVSRSCALPGWVLHEIAAAEAAKRLVRETVGPLFERLIPVSVLNVCVTNMVGGEADGSGMGDIGEMFRRRGVVERSIAVTEMSDNGDVEGEWQEEEDGASDTWDDYPAGGDDAVDADGKSGGSRKCLRCDRLIPGFAALAHERYHALELEEDR
ncbi:hypothetical protein C8A05DRAFT_44904 [Staphylotrichum tortipilum]|uniref:UmuC domain-containing protein n=1 Tax=Staphylotrichum tortipilum TaxID=2831512 RepID=A0AAN6MJN4_9PEZI|nr:hypothetical protein C8A05DRAFT_44904 [Staphylotrichum longicolle]